MEENSYQKMLIFSGNPASFMDEEIVEIGIYEYGSDVVIGMQEGQTIKWKDTIITSRIHILEEFEPKGTQKLKTEDIIGELNKVPMNIRKFIITIVLAPFGHPHEDYFSKRSGRKITALASSDYEKQQITIYPTPIGREATRDMLARQFTLAHEAGHIIDAAIEPPEMGFFAYSPKWTKAICEDTRVKRNRSDLPSYLVSLYAEESNSLREDFADSVMYFSDEGRYKEFLRNNFPNRYKILEDLLNDKTTFQ